ncbi:MAG TPA: glycosyltransferase family 4 protein [Terracidiphilus sp.]|jgi:glycosyltransferase involved in cell wall biosynthesis|nr:glycosyltransferase family 4 protein [Terracidiphilus sp.]
MTHAYPDRVLISGGREVGGVGSFAESLRAGFAEYGIPVEIVPPAGVASRGADLRSPRVLKILSTSAVFVAPFARRTICVAHGVPRADAQGWMRLGSIIASFKLANRCRGAQLVAVSHYTAATLGAVFNVRTDAVVYNPAKPLYLEPAPEPPPESGEDRRYVTYVGRLIRAKNLHRILPAVRDLMDETPGLRMCLIGAGEERATLEAMAAGDPRFEFHGTPDDVQVREQLRRSRLFVSGNEVEGFGIAYLEALAQGCVVAMPACGGGLEIAPGMVGRAVQLLPLSWDRAEVVAVLRHALREPWTPIATERFSAAAAAGGYLGVDARFLADGIVWRGRNAEATAAIPALEEQAGRGLSRRRGISQ